MIGLLDQIVDVSFDLYHLLVDHPHLLLLHLTIFQHLSNSLHFLSMGNLHFFKQSHDNLPFFLVLRLLLINQLSVVVMDIPQSFLQSRKMLSRHILDSIFPLGIGLRVLLVVTQFISGIVVIFLRRMGIVLKIFDIGWFPGPAFLTRFHFGMLLVGNMYGRYDLFRRLMPTLLHHFFLHYLNQNINKVVNLLLN